MLLTDLQMHASAEHDQAVELPITVLRPYKALREVECPECHSSMNRNALAGHRDEIAPFGAVRVPVPRRPPPPGPGGPPGPPAGSGDPIPREQLEALGYADPSPAPR